MKKQIHLKRLARYFIVVLELNFKYKIPLAILQAGYFLFFLIFNTCRKVFVYFKELINKRYIKFNYSYQ